MKRYIVRERRGGGWWVYDGETYILLGPYDDQRIAVEVAAKLNAKHERTKGKP